MNTDINAVMLRLDAGLHPNDVEQRLTFERMQTKMRLILRVFSCHSAVDAVPPPATAVPRQRGPTPGSTSHGAGAFTGHSAGVGPARRPLLERAVRPSLLPSVNRQEDTTRRGFSVRARLPRRRAGPVWASLVRAMTSMTWRTQSRTFSAPLSLVEHHHHRARSSHRRRPHQVPALVVPCTLTG